MSDTIKARIERAIIAALETLTQVGPGGVFDGQTDVPDGTVSGRSNDGQWTVFVLFGDDENPEDRQSKSGIETWVFPVSLVVVLPVNTSETGRDERTLRSDVHRLLTPLMVNRGVAYGAEGGSFDFGPGWGGLAETTEPLGGAGQADGRYGPGTVMMYEVRYRHRRGDATAV